MLPISQSLHVFPPLDELPHDLHIDLSTRLKPFTVIQNELVVSLRDVLGVDVRFAKRTSILSSDSPIAVHSMLATIVEYVNENVGIDDDVDGLRSALASNCCFFFFFC
ncbi:hypothetical protein K503DRAFT_600165 [Rhizopogon vinicolor AM-OR11-026]|uniref:Uncharacterized protein n=1 Tax=Rhizopogon vinicolor AM-OR11-026 TaxID=1314800 RepID=A0A1B7MIU8_9AGAM|nr:hypothetical protein K503DRAFT_600165 [Rhizopogon vinicolor AM-OR11-026]